MGSNAYTPARGGFVGDAFMLANEMSSNDRFCIFEHNMVAAVAPV